MAAPGKHSAGPSFGAASQTTFERLMQILRPGAYDFGKAPTLRVA